MGNIVKIYNTEIEFPIKDGETILKAALSSGINLSHSCSNGQCGKCEAKLVEGDAFDGVSKFSIVDGTAILTCCSIVNSDVIIEAE